MSKNLYLSQNSPKIYILVAVVVWSSFQSKSSKNLDMSQNFSKISILFKSLKIIENLNIVHVFEISKYLDFSQNFRKIFVLIKV